MLVSELIQDPKNANKGTKRGREAVAHSLKEFGAGRSVLIDSKGRLIAGNKTASEAQAAGIDNVIVVKTDGTQLVAVQRTDLDLETDPKAKGLALADNRVGQLGLDWDAAVLNELAGDLDLSAFFTESELGSIFAELPTDSSADDDVPSAPTVARTIPGTLYRLGGHRLLCGDATKIGDVERLMGGERADMVWTDPPYNVAYVGKTEDSLTIENDRMLDGEFRQFLCDAFTAAFAVTEAGGAIYVAHADSEGENFRGAVRESGWLFKQCLMWAKNSMVLGRQDYQWKHEPILYGWKPGAAHKWFSDRKQTTVLEYDRPSRSPEHPTMKPVALVEYCIRNSSPKGGKVLDLFGGSGTTLMACQASGRSAYLLELDPIYCDVIVRRWEEHTGLTAEVLE